MIWRAILVGPLFASFGCFNSIRYEYLMYSDLFSVRRSDGSETKIRVAVRATKRQDLLALVLNDRVVDQQSIWSSRAMVGLVADEHGQAIIVRCYPIDARDEAYDYRCKLFVEGRLHEKFDIVRRIYPPHAEKSE